MAAARAIVGSLQRCQNDSLRYETSLPADQVVKG
jgi:hypothetical protein